MQARCVSSIEPQFENDPRKEKCAIAYNRTEQSILVLEQFTQCMLIFVSGEDTICLKQRRQLNPQGSEIVKVS